MRQENVVVDVLVY